jgi:predicted Zn-dependent peptidase
MPDRIASVTTASLLDQLAEFLDLDTMTFVVVGDRAVIEPQLAALKLGTFTEVTADGRPVQVEQR